MSQAALEAASKRFLARIGADRTKLRSVTNSRTFELPPLAFSWFSSRSMTFRQYNAKIFEPWLQRSYYDEPPPPCTDKPETHYLPHLDPYALAMSEQVRETALRAFWKLRSTDVASGPQGRGRMERWLRMSELEREDLLLSIFEQEQVMCEEIQGYVTRCECPELTLALAHGGGHRLKALLLSCISFPPNLPLDELFPIPNDAWDRLHRIGKYEPAAPLSKAKRAFVMHDLFFRLKGLFLFCLEWISLMDGKGHLPSHPLAVPPLPLNAETAPATASLNSSADFKKLQDRSLSLGAAGPQCARCNKHSSPSVKLLLCSRCKAVGRLTWYCGAKCQQLHYSVHRVSGCGKPSGSDPGLVTSPTPDVARKPENVLLRDSPFLRKDLHALRAAFHPDGEVMYVSASYTAGQDPIEMGAQALWEGCAREDFEKGGMTTVSSTGEVFTTIEPESAERKEQVVLASMPTSPAKTLRNRKKKERKLAKKAQENQGSISEATKSRKQSDEAERLDTTDDAKKLGDKLEQTRL